MSRKTIFWTLPLVLLLLSWSHNPIDNTKKSVDEIKTANQLIQLVNVHRESLGKSKLIRNSLADQLAAEHVNYMISKKDVNNDNFEVRWEALEQQANAKEITENVGLDISAEKAMNAYLSRVWLRANVEGDFTHTGIAVKKDENGNYYYLQIFYNK
jgi:uncharacterized protein YkwD